MWQQNHCGIFKSEDAGANWTRLSGNGLPAGTMGRIGLDVSRSNPNVVYALIEVAPDQEPSRMRLLLASSLL